MGEYLALVVLAAGAAGGIVAHWGRNEGKLKLPGRDSRRIIDPGVLGDMFAGAIVGMAVFFLTGSLFGVELTVDMKLSEFYRVVALAIIAGVGGYPLLMGLLRKAFPDLIGGDSPTDPEIEDLLETGRWAVERDEYERSLQIYEAVLKKSPVNLRGLLGKATSLKELGRPADAVTVMNEALREYPSSVHALYNRSCYRALTGKGKKALRDLRKVIGMAGHYKNRAKEDADFENMRDLKEFAKLVGMVPLNPLGGDPLPSEAAAGGGRLLNLETSPENEETLD